MGSKSLGETLRRARELAGLRQVDLANRAQVSQNLISQIESGDREGARFVTVAALAYELGLSLDQIASNMGLRPGHRGQAQDLSRPEISQALALVEEQIEKTQASTAKLEEAAGVLRTVSLRARRRKP